jgi:hypothetical protein
MRAGTENVMQKTTSKYFHDHRISCSSIRIKIHLRFVDKSPGCKLMKSDKKASLLEIRTSRRSAIHKRGMLVGAVYFIHSSFTFRKDSGCHNNARVAFLSRFSTFVCCLSAAARARVQVRERNSLARSLLAAAVLIF